MKLDQRLVDAAIELMDRRYGVDQIGGAAAAYTREGSLLTSTYPAYENNNAVLCYETGVICEAHKLNEAITAIVCVARTPPSTKVMIWTPCGICQERLYYWGPEVELAVPDPQDSSRWLAKTLREVQPYFWADVFTEADPGK